MPADKCEIEPELSQKVNVHFVESLSRKISFLDNLRLIHFSSDFIFSGKESTPYKVNSKPDPINIYGKHKYEAENIIRETLPSTGHIIRFASLVSISKERKTFLEKVIQRAKNSETVSVVGDLSISVATSDLITKAVIECQESRPPLLHAVHVGQTSWYDIAVCAFNALELEIPIIKVSAKEFQTSAQRPRYSVLEPSREIVEIDSRNWDIAITEYVKRNFQID
jgi:dTDP-4-dehydrorhamnose reductase